MASPLTALLGALLYEAGMSSVTYKGTIMPSGTCNITAAATSNLTVPNPIQENAHIIATFWSAHYGTHTKCGVALCDEKGVDCSVEPTTSDAYWSYGPFFPTSELSLLREGGRQPRALLPRLRRRLLQVPPVDPGDPAKFVYPPTRLGGFDGGENAIIE
ncbi:hypothetical protein SO694_00074028 [Aureococcus anophagefferens]|uniref:Uncharacterized protein n=1 Tax=Aureococcus anophagefferens TaxID=44056 RepID=A0ABR1FHE3_AURAN